MINKTTAVSAISLALLAQNKGVSIVPTGGTPLADLVSKTKALNIARCAPLTGTDKTPEEELVDVADYFDFITSSRDGVISAHDRAMDEYIEQISSAVKNHISFAKNTVAPLVIAMGASVQKQLGTPRLPAADFCINVLDLPAPMQSSSFEDVIAKYEGSTKLPPERELSLGEATGEQILELMKTGSKEADSLIAQWFASKPVDFFLDIWNNLFRDWKVSKPTNVFKMEEVLRLKNEGVDYALAVYLLARKLFDEVPENTGMSLNVYQDTVAQYRDYSGFILNLEYTNNNNALRAGALVKSVSLNRRSIYVVGPIYREWINNGNTNEVLLGMLVGPLTTYTVANIAESKERFVKDWDNFEKFTSLSYKNNAFNTFKTALQYAFEEIQKEVSEIEKELIIEKPDAVNNINRLFKEQLNLVTTSDMNDLHETCLKLVCRSRFFYTESEKILRGINEATKANPGIDIRQAALLSTIEYVIDYVANQMVAG